MSEKGDLFVILFLCLGFATRHFYHFAVWVGLEAAQTVWDCGSIDSFGGSVVSFVNPLCFDAAFETA